MARRRTRRRGPGAGSTRSTPSSSSSSPSTRCASSSAPTRASTGSSSKAASSRTSSPKYTRADFYLRALTRDDVDELARRFTACADGAAVATGCRVEVTPDPTIHEPMKPNGAMAALFERNLGLIGFSVDPDDGESGYGSTDFGNMTRALPTIQPFIPIAPARLPRHPPRVRGLSGSPLHRLWLV